MYGNIVKTDTTWKFKAENYVSFYENNWTQICSLVFGLVMLDGNNKIRHSGDVICLSVKSSLHARPFT